jgi:hypothetical protein
MPGARPVELVNDLEVDPDLLDLGRAVQLVVGIEAGASVLEFDLLAVLAATAVGVGLAQAQDSGQEHDRPGSSPSAAPALLRKLDQMEERIRALKNQLRQKEARDIARARGRAPASPPADGSQGPAGRRQERGQATQRAKQGGRRSTARLGNACGEG